MAVGESGRIVIDVDPEVKRRLYSALALSGSTLKDWFLKNALTFCDESRQPLLFPNHSDNLSAPEDNAQNHGSSRFASTNSIGPSNALNP
jgi:hypothetical protein